MQAHAIAGPWAAGERVLVCISEDPRAAGLVRYAKRLADRLHAPWTALYVETDEALQLSEEQRDRIADTLRLAERLAAETATVPGGTRIADDVIAYAQANNVTQIIIGKSTRSRWFEILHGSVVHDLVRRSGNISVHVIAGEEVERRAGSQEDGRDAAGCTRPMSSLMSIALLSVLAALGVGRARPAFVGVGERRPGLPDGRRRRCGSLRPLALSARRCRSLARLQFLFSAAALHLHHRRSDERRRALFSSRSWRYWSRTLPLACALQAVIAQAGLATTEALYAFSRKLAGVGRLTTCCGQSAFQIASMLNVRVVLLLPEAAA